MMSLLIKDFSVFMFWNVCGCLELHVPDHARHLLLPHAQDHPQRPEAAEPAAEQEGRHQAGRLRPGQDLRHPRQSVHPRGSHPLVPRTRSTPRLVRVRVSLTLTLLVLVCRSP